MNMMHNKRRSSPAWKYFIRNIKARTVHCLICKKKFLNSGTTTNLLKHLKSMHPSHYDQRFSKEPFSNTIVSASSSTIPEIIKIKCENQSNQIKEDIVSTDELKAGAFVTNFSPQMNCGGEFNDEEQPNYAIKVLEKEKYTVSEDILQQNETTDPSIIDKSIVDMICTDLLPLHFIENVGFRNLLYLLKPNYDIPTKKRLIEQLLPERYNSAEMATIDILQKIKYLSISIELWQRNLQTFLTLTIHLVNESTLISLALESKELGNNSPEHISESILQILEDWQIKQKVINFVIDSSKQNDAFSSWNRITDIPKTLCVAHEIDDIVGNVIHTASDSLSQLVKKSQQIIEYFIQNESELVNMDEFKTINDFPTRWNSILFMMKEVVKSKRCLDEEIFNSFTLEEWNSLDECITILNLVEQFTEILSNEQYSFISCIIPLIRGLSNSFNNNNVHTLVGSQLSSELYSHITKRLDLESNRIAACATFLDPRFKRAAFSSEMNAEQAQKWVVEELKQNLNHKQQLQEPPLAQSNVETIPKDSNQNSSNNASNDGGLWDFFDKKVQVGNYFDDAESSANISASQYVELPYLDRKLNPLEFWENKKYVYPALHDLAIKYLCIPATSIPAKRIFTKSGNDWNTRRNLMEAKWMNEILFMNTFLKCYDF